MRMLEFGGVQKSSLVDYPGKIVMTLFLPGCNFRCGFCHNKDLVLNPERLDVINEDEVLSLLEKRRELIDGICITGGEPLFSDIGSLKLFIEKVKSIHRSDGEFVVKLDTNGSYPDRLSKLMPLVDFVAMDIKTSSEKYLDCVKSGYKEEHIMRSIDLIKNSGKDYEFRTTLVPGVVGLSDFESIAKMISGADRMILQKFIPDNTLDETFSEVNAYPDEVFHEARNILQDSVKEVIIR